MRKFWAHLIIFLVAFFVYLSNTPSDYYRDLKENTYLNLLTSADAVPNTFLPYLLYYHRSIDFSPITFHFRQFDSYKKNQYFIVTTAKGKFSAYPILTGILATPIYLIPLAFNKIPTLAYHENILKILLLGRITAALYSSISVVLFYSILKKVGGNNLTQLIFTAFFAFGTSMWSISSRVLWTHTTVVFFSCLLILLLLQQDKTIKTQFLMGVISGMLLLARPTAAVIVFFTSVYLYIHTTNKRMVVFFALGFLPCLITMLVYNHLLFGNLISGGYSARNDIRWTTSLLEGFYKQIFVPGKGFLFVTPPLLLSFVAFFKIFTDKNFGGTNNALYRYFAVSFFASFLIYSKWYSWFGGSSFGYRFFTDLLPIMVILIYELCKNLQGKLVVVLYVLLAYSVYTQWNAVYYLKSTCKPDYMYTFECLKPGVLENTKK